jgi:metal-dependent amidase/aminoacylase/carboxypeptidase family protein
MVIAYTSVSALRQQTMPGDIIQGMISNGGTAPNIIHAYSSGDFNIRAPTRARVKQLMPKVRACFEAAAIATGAILKFTVEMGYDDQMPNWALGKSYREYFNQLGGAIMPMPEDYVDGRISASSDEGNVSYALPSICVAFKLNSEVGGHNPAFAAAAGTKESFEKCLMVSKALAGTAIDVLTKPAYLEEVKSEWRESVEKDLRLSGVK